MTVPPHVTGEPGRACPCNGSSSIWNVVTLVRATRYRPSYAVCGVLVESTRPTTQTDSPVANVPCDARNCSSSRPDEALIVCTDEDPCAGGTVLLFPR